jgi:hypothetical protein
MQIRGAVASVLTQCRPGCRYSLGAFHRVRASSMHIFSLASDGYLVTSVLVTLQMGHLWNCDIFSSSSSQSCIKCLVRLNEGERRLGDTRSRKFISRTLQSPRHSTPVNRKQIDELNTFQTVSSKRGDEESRCNRTKFPLGWEPGSNTLRDGPARMKARNEPRALISVSPAGRSHA